MKKIFLLLAAVGVIFTACEPANGLDDDNNGNNGNNTEQPGGGNQGEEPIFITDNESDIVVEAKGGTVVVTVSTNLEYSVVIPEEAQSWLSVADTRAIRMEKLTFTIAKNEADAERSAVVKLLGSDNAELQSLSFVQKGASAEEEIPADKTQAIKFQDENTKLLCTLHWDENEDGELSYEEAAAVTDLGTAFKGSSILAFTELKYFTSLEKIADSAFEGCVSLVKITMPEQLTTIGTSALKGCTNLKKIAIPNAVTEIGGNAFNGCTSLTRVDISDLSAWCKISFGYDSANPLRNGAKLYLNGSELTDITIPLDIIEIKAYAFSGYTSLTSVTIPDSVTTIENYAFSGCSSLSSVYFNGTTPPTLGNNTFTINNSDATKNPKIYIPSDTENVYLSSDWPTEYKKWIVLDYSNISPIFKIEYTTNDSKIITLQTTKITNAAILSHTYNDNKGVILFDKPITSIGQRAFRDCTSLTSVTIPDSVTEIGYDAFSGCTLLTRVDISDLSAWCKMSFDYGANPLCHGAKLYLNGSELTDITIPSDITDIQNYAFNGCTSLTSVTIPDSVTAIGDYAFLGCTSLTSATIGNGVTSIGYAAFNGCTSLTSVTIPDNVTSIGDNAFSGCSSLTSVTILDGVTSIGSHAFENCTSLKSVTIPDSVTEIGYDAFSGCTSLTSVTIPDSVTLIGYNAFRDCISLTSVTIGNSVTSIEIYAFSGCSSLTEIYCKPTTPPAIYYSRYDSPSRSFPFNEGMKIYVPRNSYDAYMQYSSYSNNKVAQTNWYMYESYIEPYDFE